jgi:4-hydroxy-tetrahydrodipicolinate synthase
MLYNVPGTSGIDLVPEEVQQLAEEGVVQSVKWSTAEVSRVRDTKLLCGPAFPVFVGNDLIAFEGLAVGADGWISCLPMIVPSKAGDAIPVIGGRKGPKRSAGALLPPDTLNKTRISSCLLPQ